MPKLLSVRRTPLMITGALTFPPCSFGFNAYPPGLNKDRVKPNGGAQGE
jgi:hypothetical protein